MRVALVAVLIPAAASFVNPASGQNTNKLPPYVRLWNAIPSAAPSSRFGFNQFVRPETAGPDENAASLRCAHIRIVPADPKVDPKMIVPNANGPVPKISTVPALPPCPSDIAAKRP